MHICKCVPRMLVLIKLFNYEGLVNFVESTVRLQHASASDKPIYMVGDSFGGCIALAVAARNPTIDLVLILVNPCQFPDCNFKVFSSLYKLPLINFYLWYTFWFSNTLWLSDSASSFGKSSLQCLLPIAESLPGGLKSAVPYLLSLIIGTWNVSLNFKLGFLNFVHVIH